MKANLRSFGWIFPLCLVALCSCDLHKKLADYHYSEAEKEFDHGDMAAAMDDISAAISQNPKWGQAYAYRGYLYLWTSNYVAALTNLDTAVQLEHDNSWAYFLRGLAKDDLNDYEGAATNYNESIRIDPNYADAWSYRALVRAELHDLDEALSDLDHALELRPDDSDTLSDRAYVHLLRDDYESAVVDASRAIELNSTNSVAYEYRGTARASLLDFTNALADYDEAVTRDPRDPEAVGGRGMIHLLQGRLEEAETDLNTAIRLCPTNATSLKGLGFAKVKRSDFDGALVIFTNALTVVSKFDSSYTAICRYTGELQFELGRDEEALQSFRQAIAVDHTDMRARFGIWLIRASRHDATEANKELSTTLASEKPEEWLQWDFCIGHFLVGDVTETNLLSQAVTSAKRPTDRDSQLCQARYYAGMKRLYNGDSAGAIESLEQCVALHQENEVENTSAVVQLRKLKGP